MALEFNILLKLEKLEFFRIGVSDPHYVVLPLFGFLERYSKVGKSERRRRALRWGLRAVKQCSRMGLI